jgi:hypothetical protein
MRINPRWKQHVRHLDLIWGPWNINYKGSHDCTWYMIQELVPFPLQGELAFDKDLLEPAEKWETRYVELCNQRQELMRRISPDSISVLNRPPSGRLLEFATNKVFEIAAAPVTKPPNFPSIIQLLWNALLALPNVRSVWLRFGTTHGIQPNFGSEQQLVLEMLGQAMPEIRRMGFVSHSIPLDFLRNYPNLVSLAMDDGSQSTIDQAWEILGSLKHLEELEIPTWTGVNRSYHQYICPLELTMLPTKAYNESAQCLGKIRVLGLELRFGPPFGLEYLSQCKSLRQLNLYSMAFPYFLTENLKVIFIKEMAETLSEMPQLEQINFYAVDPSLGKDKSVIYFRPLSVRNEIPLRWVTSKRFFTRQK